METMFPVYGVGARFRKTSFKKLDYHSPLEGESERPIRRGADAGVSERQRRMAKDDAVGGRRRRLRMAAPYKRDATLNPPPTLLYSAVTNKSTCPLPGFDILCPPERMAAAAAGNQWEQVYPQEENRR